MVAISTIILWLMNISGLVMWGYVLILSIEAIGGSIKMSWNPFKNIRYWINWFILFTSLCVVLYRVDDIWMQKTMHYEWLRSFASIICPLCFIWHYKIKGITSSVVLAVADFWNGKE